MVRIYPNFSCGLSADKNSATNSAICTGLGLTYTHRTWTTADQTILIFRLGDSTIHSYRPIAPTILIIRPNCHKSQPKVPIVGIVSVHPNSIYHNTFSAGWIHPGATWKFTTFRRHPCWSRAGREEGKRTEEMWKRKRLERKR